MVLAQLRRHPCYHGQIGYPDEGIDIFQFHSGSKDVEGVLLIAHIRAVREDPSRDADLSERDKDGDVKR